jgi:outer membrane protein, heavy metal efflux system
MKPRCAVLTLLLACAPATHPPPVGPQPVPSGWEPEVRLREKLPRGAPREIVLDDRDGLSVDEAAILAIDQNPRLRAARAGRGIDQAELLAAGLLPNPHLDGSLDVPIFGPEAKVLGYGAGMSWNVTPLISRSARVSAATENLVAVDLEIAWQEWQVAQAARLHTIRAICLQRRAALARELEQTWEKRLQGLRQALAQGALTALEVSSAQRAHADARVQRLQLDQLYVAERAELNRALGIEPSRQMALDASFQAADAISSLDALLAQLPSRRLDLLALQHAQRSGDERLRAAVLAQFPPLEIGFNTRREVDREGSLGIALSIELPFFDRNQAAVAHERARTTQVAAEYQARLLDARADVARAAAEWAIVRQQLTAAREAARAADQVAEQTRTAALSGAMSQLLATDVLERAYRSRLEVLEIEQASAELEVALALASGHQP